MLGVGGQGEECFFHWFRLILALAIWPSGEKREKFDLLELIGRRC